MARYAMVENTSGIVVNVIEWDGNDASWRAPTGYTMVEDTAIVSGPGSRYDGATFIPPPAGDVGTAFIADAETTSAPPSKTHPNKKK